MYYGVLAWIIDKLAARGANTYDFGGVDEANNPGVFDFKAGWGGEFVRRNRPSILISVSLPGLRGGWIVGRK